MPYGTDVTDASRVVNLQDYDEAFDRLHAYLKEIRKKQVRLVHYMTLLVTSKTVIFALADFIHM